MDPMILIKECHKAGVAIRLEDGVLVLLGNPDSLATQRRILGPYKEKIIAHLKEKQRLQKEWAFRHYVTWFIREIGKRNERR